MVRHKGLMIILDGLGDHSCAELQGQTPLEAASTPNFDRLAHEGLTGLVDPLYAGVPVGTHTGTGVLLGLAPADAALLARGPVEAAGIGLDLQPGEVVLRCNFATLGEEGEGLTIVNRRAGRIREGTTELAEALQSLPLGDGITGDLYPATHHRAVLRLRGANLSDGFTDTDPGSGREARGVQLAQARDGRDQSAVRTAEAVNCFVREAYQRLSRHPLNLERVDKGLLPANGVLSRSAGECAQLRNVVTHVGLDAAVVAGEHTVEGLGRLFGFHTIREPGFTAMPHTDLEAKLAATLKALETHDLVFLHIKGPDISAHDRDPAGKRACLERIDQIVGRLPRSELVIAVTGDHSTDCNFGRHCGDPVPGLLTAPNGRRDLTGLFGESHCMAGGLGRLTATSFLISMLDAMGAIGNFRPADREFILPG